MADGTDPLEVWSVATFDVVVLGLLLVIAGHLSGALSDVLLGFGTLPGVLTFGYLWVLALLAIRWALAGGGIERAREDGLASLLLRGTGGGAFVGAAFAAGVFLSSGVIASLTGGARFSQFVVVGLVAAVIGAVVGAAVGTLFALVDVGLARIADLVVRRRPA